MLVRDVMTTDVVTVKPSTTLKDASRLLVDRRISGVPVTDDGRVIGVISERDFLVKEQGRPISTRRRLFPWFDADQPTKADLAKREARDVAGAMSSPPITISPTASVAIAAARMLEANVSRLPVVHDDHLVGIVTRADLLRAFARSDAEIEREVVVDVLGRHMLLEPGEAQATVHDGHVLITTRQPIDVEIVERLAARVPGVVSVTTETASTAVPSRA